MRLMMKRYAIEIGLRMSIYPHLWRSSSITLMDEAGMTQAQIMAQSGHSEPKSLKTYIRPSSTLVRKQTREALDIYNKKPQPKPKPEINKKDEPEQYIALLKDGIISATDFRQLIATDKKPDINSYFQ